MSLTGNVVRSISWLAVAQVGQRVASLVITALLSRLLGPEDFGLIAMAMVAVNLVSVFRELGITPSLVQRTELRAEHLDSGFWLNIGAGVLLYVAGAIATIPLSATMRDPRIVPVMLGLLLSVPIYTLAQVPDAILQRRLAFKSLALIEVTATAASGALGLTLAFTGFGVWALVAQNVGFAAAMTVGRALVAGWLPRFRFEWKSAKETLRFSGSVFGCSLTAYGMRNVDNAMVGALLGTTALGYYSLAYNLMLLPGYALTGVVGRVIFPALSSIKDDITRVRLGYLRALRVLGTISVPVVIGLAATAPLVVQLVYGAKWLPSASLLQVLSVVGVLEALNMWGVIFYAVGRPNLMLGWFTLSVALMAVAVRIGLHWGLPGVAWAYALIAPVTLGAPHLIVSRIIGLNVRDLLRAILPSLVSSTLMGCIIVLLDRVIIPSAVPTAVRLAILVSAGMLSYATLMAGLAVRGDGLRGMIGWIAGNHLAPSEG